QQVKTIGVVQPLEGLIKIMSAEVMQKAALRRSHAQYAGKNSIQGSLRESEVRTPEFYLMMGKRGIKSSHKSSDWVIGELGNLSACTQITHLTDYPLLPLTR